MMDEDECYCMGIECEVCHAPCNTRIAALEAEVAELRAKVASVETFPHGFDHDGYEAYLVELDAWHAPTHEASSCPECHGTERHKLSCGQRLPER